jgi:hypothetical protein
VGGEFNVRRKSGASPRIVLSYPDVYEIGSEPGLQILYSWLHQHAGHVERAYCRGPIWRVSGAARSPGT